MSIFDKIREWVDAVSDGADPIEALHGHVCDSTCWHFPGYEDGCVRCTCRWEMGSDHRHFNGSAHEPACWVHRVYLEMGGLAAGVQTARTAPGLWKVGT